jgi:hypothetical protein
MMIVSRFHFKMILKILNVLDLDLMFNVKDKSDDLMNKAIGN